MLDEAHKRRAAVATMLGIFAYKVALSGFGPIFSELLISRACASLGLPAYPASGCVQSDDASAIAATRLSYYNLMTSIPALLTVSLYAMLADTRGRQLTLTLCYVGGLLQCMAVWLVPAGRICFASLCIDDSFWALLAVASAVSFFGSWSVALSTSFAVMADVTEGAPHRTRATVFGLMEAFNIGGMIIGPTATGYFAEHYGLQQSFLFTVLGSGVAVLCTGFAYRETLEDEKRKPWIWARANPIGSVCLLLRHHILVRFLLMLIFVDLANNALFTLSTFYFTRVSGFDEEQNGYVQTVSAAAMSVGLLVVLPIMQRYIRVKSIIIFSVVGSTLQLAMTAALSSTAIANWPGLQVWPFVCVVCQLTLALWFPIMRATAATLFGAQRFAIALGAVATTQALNGVLGPTLWPLIYATATGQSIHDQTHHHTHHGGEHGGSAGGSCDGSSSSSDLDDNGTTGSNNIWHSPSLAFYIATVWSALGVVVAWTFPSLEGDALAMVANDLARAEEDQRDSSSVERAAVSHHMHGAGVTQELGHSSSNNSNEQRHRGLRGRGMLGTSKGRGAEAPLREGLIN